MSSCTGSDRGPSLRVARFATPWGPGRLAMLADLPFELELPDAAAGHVSAGAEPVRPATLGRPAAAAGSPAAVWVGLLERYFAGRPVRFELDVETFCAAHGFTGFETAVYRALAAVPYGRVTSYRDLAVAAGRPLAWRAAGSAMALNPLPIVLPCHRVVRSDGTLGHYGSDPSWKARLLRLEGVTVLSGGTAADPSARLVPAAPQGERMPSVRRSLSLSAGRAARS